MFTLRFLKRHFWYSISKNPWNQNVSDVFQTVSQKQMEITVEMRAVQRCASHWLIIIKPYRITQSDLPPFSIRAIKRLVKGLIKKITEWLSLSSPFTLIYEVLKNQTVIMESFFLPSSHTSVSLSQIWCCLMKIIRWDKLLQEKGCRSSEFLMRKTESDLFITEPLYTQHKHCKVMGWIIKYNAL